MAIITVKEAAKAYPCFGTESTVRNLINKAQPLVDRRTGAVIRQGNGLAEAGAILKVGVRVYLDTERVDSWLENKRVGAEG